MNCFLNRNMAKCATLITGKEHYDASSYEEYEVDRLG